MAGAEGLIFVLLVIFPLGQLIRLNFDVFGARVPIQPLDVVAGLSIVWFILGKLKKPKGLRPISAFLLIAAFSLLFSLTIFEPRQLAIGSLYFLRLLAYASFFLVSYNLVLKNKRLKPRLFHSLIVVSAATGLFGWIQYFWLPDLRALRFLGWDDHLYRLVGTFLDPGFTGLILTFGFLLSLVKFLETKDKRLIVLLAFFLLSVGFTYSRASYLALLAGSLVAFGVKKRLRQVAVVFLALLFISFLLPRPAGEGVKLERLSSVYLRLENYQETLKIFKHSPLFGVGYNNLCQARQKYLGEADFTSHACSGSDSSLLLVLATTGVVGLLVFLNLIYTLVKNAGKEIYGYSFLAVLTALLIHSLFVNSLFYPWVMGYMAILLSVSLRSKKKGKRSLG